jgi:hypothetical protein
MIDLSSSNSTNYASLSRTTPVLSIFVNAAILRLGTKYSIGKTASRPYTNLKGVCIVSFLQVVL